MFNIWLWTKTLWELWFSGRNCSASQEKQFLIKGVLQYLAFFLVPKRMEFLSLTFNHRQLCLFMKVLYFHMVHKVNVIVQAVSKEDWLTSIDLKDPQAVPPFCLQGMDILDSADPIGALTLCITASLQYFFLLWGKRIQFLPYLGNWLIYAPIWDQTTYNTMFAACNSAEFPGCIHWCRT